MWRKILLSLSLLTLLAGSAGAQSHDSPTIEVSLSRRGNRTPFQAVPAAEVVSPEASVSGAVAARPPERLPYVFPQHASAPLTTTRVPILEYHYSTFHMSDGVMMKTEWFEAQMRWLAENGFNTLSSSEFGAFLNGTYLPPMRSVLLTFDVGVSRFDDYANVVIPALRQYGFRAVFFVLASQIDEECDGVTTCWPMLLQWRDEGLISIESHSLNHQDYTTLTPEQIVLDAGRSKAIIEAHTGQPVTGICYPFDAVNPAAFDLLPALGYRFAVGGPTRPERNALSGDPEPFNLPRFYPYSGKATYPAMIGAGGATFEEMLLRAVSER
jgi:peptidoglycan/xylan/chitin deacetylase (PgdA/CDA1 family)